jgi:hypothetical protein
VRHLDFAIQRVLPHFDTAQKNGAKASTTPIRSGSAAKHRKVAKSQD